VLTIRQATGARFGHSAWVSKLSVHVSAYDPRWPRRAARLVARLHTALGPDALRIDHIGSTAIPLMDAKDLLDLQVSVMDLATAAVRFDEPLRGLGFERMPYDHDHVPVGWSDDAALWAKRYWQRRNHADGDVNLHVRLAGSPNERLALLFRDWMCAHPEVVVPYSAIKRTLAGAAPDGDRYAELKDPIVDLVIVVAEQWAAETMWRPLGTASD
jgi:GrpB-like predicted nucleotidyltransferase (UPF0157 family)